MAQDKIVYLFGAGATHAELDNIGEDIRLTIGDVTNRVLLKARRERLFKKVLLFLGTEHDTTTNIELLISLLENNSQIIEDTIEDDISVEKIIKKIKALMEDDITHALTKKRLAKFSLYKGVLEFHNLIKEKEDLLGLITLNYDSALDNAYRRVFGYDPDYGKSSEHEKTDQGADKMPLLKLHGSFSWIKEVFIGKPQKISIMPMGANKNFLRPPYNFIWGRSLELLVSCDILRVIGCSLSPNDTHIIDLLLKAHIIKGSAIKIQIISRDSNGTKIKNRYSFFPDILTSGQITDPRIPNPDIGNIFAEWLKVFASNSLTIQQIQRTDYLKKVVL